MPGFMDYFLPSLLKGIGSGGNIFAQYMLQEEQQEEKDRKLAAAEWRTDQAANKRYFREQKLAADKSRDLEYRMRLSHRLGREPKVPTEQQKIMQGLTQEAAEVDIAHTKAQMGQVGEAPPVRPPTIETATQLYNVVYGIASKLSDPVWREMAPPQEVAQWETMLQTGIANYNIVASKLGLQVISLGDTGPVPTGTPLIGLPAWTGGAYQGPPQQGPTLTSPAAGVERPSTLGSAINWLTRPPTDRETERAMRQGSGWGKRGATPALDVLSSTPTPTAPTPTLTPSMEVRPDPYTAGDTKEEYFGKLTDAGFSRSETERFMLKHFPDLR